MQQLVGRLTALDPEASATLKVVSYFDTLAGPVRCRRRPRRRCRIGRPGSQVVETALDRGRHAGPSVFPAVHRHVRDAEPCRQLFLAQSDADSQFPDARRADMPAVVSRARGTHRLTPPPSRRLSL